MTVCLEHLRLDLALKDVSSELNRALDLERRFLEAGDLTLTAELEAVVAQVQRRHLDAVDFIQTPCR
jgi:hypothetical protein